MSVPNYRREDRIPCGCGCGELIRAFSKYDGKPRKIKNGHQNRFFAQQGKYKLPRPNRRGIKSWNWKGGKIELDGYIRIRVPNHPTASNSYVLEHRHIMEQHLGRYLTKDEDVHHINGDKKDNRIENLQLIRHSKHSTLSNQWRTEKTKGRHCILCNATESKNPYRKTTCWLTQPVTKERWICWRCYQRIWQQQKRSDNCKDLNQLNQLRKRKLKV